MFGLEFVIISNLVSFVATGKGVSDNAVSVVTGEDCAVMHVLKDEEYCKSKLDKEVKKNIIKVEEKKPSSFHEKEMKKIEEFKKSIKWI